jgi:hypothetical protein
MAARRSRREATGEAQTPKAAAGGAAPSEQEEADERRRAEEIRELTSPTKLLRRSLTRIALIFLVLWLVRQFQSRGRFG